MTQRRQVMKAALGLAGSALAGSAKAIDAPQPAGPKVLRYAIRVAETGFDPAQISDLYSRTICQAMFDPPLQFEFLARPYRLRPSTLVALPEVSADYRVFTCRVKPGIFFADDPAFKGARRELIAADYVYSFKRHYDPRLKSNQLYRFENAKVLGLTELRRELMAAGKPFDYDREVAGFRTLDRYTFEVRLGEPDPRFLDDQLTDVMCSAVAREVVEFYGDEVMQHPVGTGAFRLASWRRASLIVLERNPGYREEFHEEDPPAGDPLAVAAAAQLRGRRLPIVDRVEIAVIEENQPRWLAFLNGEHDILEEVPPDFADLIIPNNQLAPNLQKRGIRMVRYARADAGFSYFNMEDPVVGGYTPEKVALRRAIGLGVDLDQEIRLVRRNQAVASQGPIAPGTWGFDAALHSEMSEFSRAKARALLDLYGYVDRDGDGWRELPSGQALQLEYATQPDSQSRALIELWQKNMAAIGIRIVFKAAKWPENLKAANAGKLMMWGASWSAGIPDGDTFLALGYGPNKGQANKARFDLPAFNRVYAAQKVLPNTPERFALMAQAQKIMIAYMPYKIHVHRIFTDLAQPWVSGYHRNVFMGMGRAYRFIDVAPRPSREKV